MLEKFLLRYSERTRDKLWRDKITLGAGASLPGKSPLVRTKVPAYFEACYPSSVHDTH